MRPAIISARDGGKRVPRKSLHSFRGGPMTAWSIETARASGCFDHMVVSTDSEDIAETLPAEGAETPFLRHAIREFGARAAIPI